MAAAEREVFHEVPLPLRIHASVVCSVEAGDVVLVGTENGVVYTLAHDGADGYRVTHERKVSYSPRTLLSLHYMESIDTVLLHIANKVYSAQVNDGVLSDLSAPLFFNVDCFTIDSARGSQRACFLSRKYLCFCVVDSRTKTRLTTELRIDAVGCRQLLYIGDRIFFATRNQYYFIQASTGMLYEMLVPLVNQHACLVKVNDYEICVASSTGLGVFLHVDGTPSQKSPIEWKTHPKRLLVCGDVLLSVTWNAISVFSLADNSPEPVQHFSYGEPPVSALVVHQNAKASVLVTVAQPTVFSLLVETDVEWQMTQSLQHLDPSKALSLLYKTNPSTEALEHFYANAGISLFNHLLFSEAFKYLLLCRNALDPASLIMLFPQLRLSDQESPVAHVFEANSIEALIAAAQERIHVISSGRKGNQHIRSAMAAASKSTQELKNEAMCQLADYLWNTRKFIASSEQELVDTALFLIKVQLSDSVTRYTLHDLLLPSNACHLQHCHTVCHTKHPIPLALLYDSKQETAEACAMLQQEMGHGNVERREEAAEALMQVVQKMEDTPLLWESARFLLNADRDRGMNVFVLGRRQVELDPEQVLPLLDSFKPSRDLKETYLEYIVFLLPSTRAIYHHALGSLYLDALEAEPSRDYYRKMLKRLLKFSSKYNPNALLDRIASLGLIEELAIVLETLGLTVRLFETCVYELGDFERAEQYCVAGETSSDVQERLTLLLALYLNPDTSRLPGPLSREALFSKAVAVFSLHEAFLDVSEFFKLACEDVSLKAMVPLLNRILPRHAHRQRMCHVTRSLSKQSHLTTTLALAGVRQFHFSITEDTLCDTCGRNIGTSVFRGLPDGSISHFQCT